MEVAVGGEDHIEAVFLSHSHSFYDPAAPDDSERRAFHDGVIAADLFGQHEFSWGYVFCHLDRPTIRDWLVIVYSPFSNVPLHQREIYRVLLAHESNAGLLK